MKKTAILNLVCFLSLLFCSCTQPQKAEHIVLENMNYVTAVVRFGHEAEYIIEDKDFCTKLFDALNVSNPAAEFQDYAEGEKALYITLHGDKSNYFNVYSSEWCTSNCGIFNVPDGTYENIESLVISQIDKYFGNATDILDNIFFDDDSTVTWGGAYSDTPVDLDDIDTIRNLLCEDTWSYAESEYITTGLNDFCRIGTESEYVTLYYYNKYVCLSKNNISCWFLLDTSTFDTIFTELVILAT